MIFEWAGYILPIIYIIFGIIQNNKITLIVGIAGIIVNTIIWYFMKNHIKR